MKWLQALEERAIQHHDLRAWQEIHDQAGFSLTAVGDLRGAVSQCQQGLELCARIGDSKVESRVLNQMAEALLLLGDLESAEESARRAVETSVAVGHKWETTRAYRSLGQIALCRGDWEGAVETFQKAVQLLEISDHVGLPWTTYLLGRAYLAQGDREEALRQFQESVTSELLGWFKKDPDVLFNRLSGLEAACDDPASFRAFCRRLREERPALSNLSLIQWFLEPVGAVREPPLSETLLHYDGFATFLAPDWVWEDPFDDCSFTVQSGLEIHAANGRDLMLANRSAPRLLRPVSGDFAVQAICVPISEEKPAVGGRPAIGGLLLWKDKQNHLRLDKGTRGEQEILFGGCLQNQGAIIGRGRLSAGISGRVYLRLERVGERMDALCSADGEAWFTAGHIAFPVEDPVQVGLHAIGNIDRSVYHGAYRDGTAIRFESFQLWGLNR